MRKLLIVLLSICAVTANAQWRMKARQTEVRTNEFDTLESLVDTNVPPWAPSNSVQAIFEWIDDNWPTGVDTNASYYYTDGTTQNMWRAIIRDNFIVGGDATFSNDVDILGDLTVSNDITAGGTITGSTGVFDTIEVGTLNASNFTFSGGLVWTNDLADSYNGYPRITGPVAGDFTSFSDGTVTLIETSSWTRILDGDLSTHSSTGRCGNGVGGTGTQSIHLDLGDVYEGYLVVKANVWSGSAGAPGNFIMTAAETNQLDGSSSTLYVPYDQKYFVSGQGGNTNNLPYVYCNMHFTRARYVGLQFSHSTTFSYMYIHEFLVYGNTPTATGLNGP